MTALLKAQQRLAALLDEEAEVRATIARLSAVSDELAALLAPRIATYAGDYDEWSREEDEENIAYALDLCRALWGASLAQFLGERMLEKIWLEQYRDMAEEYAQAASYARELGQLRYEDRRGA
jgi:hypothetical protein